jgi:hydroxymethylbilane synthase
VRRASGWTERVEIVPVTASGDKMLDRPLAEIGGKALWTKELDAWLLSGEIDFAVHSAKDVETIRPAEIAIAAVLPREDVRDVLLGAAVHWPPCRRARGSAPARRAAPRRLHLRPDCRWSGFAAMSPPGWPSCGGRGRRNAPGARRAQPAGDGHLGTPLDPEEWLPAPGQGAIAIECRAADVETLSAAGGIDHAPSRAALLAERALLAALGGNCHSPIAVLTCTEGAELTLRAARSQSGRCRTCGSRSDFCCHRP